MDPQLLQHAFEAVAARQPDAIALTWRHGRLSFAELDRRADRWADQLAVGGAGPDVAVVLRLRRWPELVVASLASVKAGSYYVPLPASYSSRQWQAIVDQLDAPLLVTDAERGVPRGCPTVSIAELDASTAPTRPAVATDPQRLAYAVFVADSAGELNGFAVSHRNALGLATDRRSAGTGCTHNLRAAPITLGLSGHELWAPLLAGRPVGPPEPARAGHRDRAAVIDRVLDACPELAVLAPCAATGTCPRTSCAASSGQPGGVRSYLLDERLHPAAEGELFLGGSGVAHGYLGRPAAGRFVPDLLLGGGELMFGTGVLARWAADGRLELIGRAADQLTIRGFRVEPAEVEAVLAGHPRVARVAVTAGGVTPAGDRQLIAHLVPRAGGLDLAALRRFAAARLPDYLVPAVFTISWPPAVTRTRAA